MPPISFFVHHQNTRVMRVGKSGNLSLSLLDFQDPHTHTRNNSMDLQALFDQEAPYQHTVRNFVAWPAEIVQLHIATQESTQVAFIEFRDKDYRIPIPQGTEIRMTNLDTGVTRWHTPDMGRVVWCPYKHKIVISCYGDFIIGVYLT